MVLLGLPLGLVTGSEGFGVQFTLGVNHVEGLDRSTYTSHELTQHLEKFDLSTRLCISRVR